MQSSLVVVSATRTDEDLFSRSTYLGRSLARFPEQLKPRLAITYSNNGETGPAKGLSSIYNEAIDQAGPEDVLLFVHDDVYLHDWFTTARIAEALNHWDIVGLAGSINPDLDQPSWGLSFDSDLKALGWQPDLQRSGAVNHFDPVHTTPTFYGPTPAECILLDGLFLATSASVLNDANVRFDDTFAFHMYDLDFCRLAKKAGLRLGTWPISVTHNSGGAFETQAFRYTARRYLDKWKSIS